MLGKCAVLKENKDNGKIQEITATKNLNSNA
jgi:hypothetical protein